MRVSLDPRDPRDSSMRKKITYRSRTPAAVEGNTEGSVATGDGHVNDDEPHEQLGFANIMPTDGSQGGEGSDSLREGRKRKHEEENEGVPAKRRRKEVRVEVVTDGPPGCVGFGPCTE
jgi:hypothetical protein